MKILIVYAHHEQKSFNGAMKDIAVTTLKQAGHEVKVSDLYASKFSSAADRADFVQAANPGYLQYVMEQKNAASKGAFAADIKEEMARLAWADFIIMQFPLWWFSVPAVMKGWIDRVFATGFAWDFGKFYDRGLLTGKKAMLAITTGGPENFYRADGPHGCDMNQVLYPIHHGVLYFCGIRPVPPFVAYSVAQIGDEQRKQYLQEYKLLLQRLPAIEPIKFHTWADFDENMKLKK